MRILLATAGSRGDVEPFAALARRVAAEGHEVRLVVPDNSGADLTGLDVVSMGVDFTRMIEDQGVSAWAALRSFRTVVRPIMHAVIVESARATMDYQPDVLISHPKVLSAPVVCEALGIPHVLVELVPAMTPTAKFPAAGTTTRNLGPFNRLTYRAAGASAAMFRGDLDEVARLVGSRPRRAAPPAATLLPISPAILAPPADWPETVHMTGPWHSDKAPSAVPEQVASFIAQGPFVYAGFGSMAAGDPIARGREVLQGIRDHGTRALLATGLGGMRIPETMLGEDVLVVESVNHELVLPAAEAAVHHGGIGTVQAATRAGVVSVIVPFIADQPFWAARLQEGRLSPAPIPRGRLTAERISRALAETVSRRDAVASAARAMSEEGGTAAAMTVIGSLTGRQATRD